MKIRFSLIWNVRRAHKSKYINKWMYSVKTHCDFDKIVKDIVKKWCASRGTDFAKKKNPSKINNSAPKLNDYWFLVKLNWVFIFYFLLCVRLCVCINGTPTNELMEIEYRKRSNKYLQSANKFSDSMNLTNQKCDSLNTLP